MRILCKSILAIAAATLIIASGCTVKSDNFLRVKGREIYNGNNESVILKGIGLGGWMLQEPYMLLLSEAAGRQTEIKAKISDLIGEKNCDRFYDSWLRNMITERDIDSLKKWGFNSIRLPMHYNLFTLSAEQEPVPGQNTWLNTGFDLTDSLLTWCRKNKMYLILDLHAAPGGQGNDKPIADVDTLKPKLWESEANLAKTVALWKKIAGKYSKEEWIGGYDILNETNYKMNGNEPLKKLFLNITSEIRKVDQRHIIFIEGNQFANDYTGLLPPWDSKMVYSFHKYWNPATMETIQKYLDIRQKYTVPFWMGESGENTNEWFKSVVNLLESNNIGWCWWTIKKLGSESSLMTVKTPEGYQKIVDFWKGKGERPTSEEAQKVLSQLAENAKIENCTINYGVLNALFSKR